MQAATRCWRARSACRISDAAWGSSKASAAVLLSAVIWARVAKIALKIVAIQERIEGNDSRARQQQGGRGCHHGDHHQLAADGALQRRDAFGKPERVRSDAVLIG